MVQSGNRNGSGMGIEMGLTVHTRQKLCDHPPFHFPLSCLSLATDSIDFIDKQDTGGVALGKREKVPQGTLGLT